jgi:hypothetical protein
MIGRTLRVLRPKAYPDRASRKADFLLGAFAMGILIILYLIFTAWGGLAGSEVTGRLQNWPVFTVASLLLIEGLLRRWVAIGAVVTLGGALVAQFLLVLLIWSQVSG